MSDEHGIDIEDDAAVDTADDDEQEAPVEEPDGAGAPDEPGRDDADSAVRETDAEEVANPDDHRDEPPNGS